jgi:hypothetical protein
MSEQSKDELTIKEKKFLKALFSNGFQIAKAYREATPNGDQLKRSTAESNGSKLYSRIRKKECWREALEAAGLDDISLAYEIKRLLRMKKVTYYEGKPIGKDDDAFIQLRAVELLAELLGKRKNQVDIKHSGNIENPVQIYLPDNGRENTQPHDTSTVNIYKPQPDNQDGEDGSGEEK